ncbi:hypothetical protein ACPB8Q_07625 [Methanocaldococcus indicus]|uniref:hypothetical protein n=1 Tax=Methanocaldococcus indicus TaxID=213231 RepID=UPI003C6DB3D3
MEELNKNQKIMHYIIHLLSKDDKWVRREVVLALIYYFSEKGYLDYKCSPMPHIWNDKIKFINISYEALEDLNYIIKNNYIQEILLSVRGLSLFIVGYKAKNNINYDNLEYLEDIKNFLKNKEIKIVENGIKVGDVEIDITEIKPVSFKSKSYIMEL